MNASAFDIESLSKILSTNVVIFLIDYINLAIIHNNKTIPILFKFDNYAPVLTNELNLSISVLEKVRYVAAKKCKLIYSMLMV